MGEGGCYEFLHGMSFSGAEDIVVHGFVLEHLPEAFDVFGGPSPVSTGTQVAELQALLLAGLDAGDGGADFLGEKLRAAAGGFVVEEDAAATGEAIDVAVDGDELLGEGFGGSVGGDGMEGSGFILRGDEGVAEDFATGGVEEAGRAGEAAVGFEHAQRGGGVALQSFLGIFEADAWTALAGEMVDFVRGNGPDQAFEASVIKDIQDVEEESGVIDFRVGKMAPEVPIRERPTGTRGAVNGVAFLQQEVA